MKSIINLLNIHKVTSFCYQRILTLYCIIISIPIRVIREFYPVNNNIWIFGAGNGKTFSDNSKHFFLYLLKNKTNEQPIWITRNKLVIKEIKDLGGTVYHNLSFYGIHYILLAKYLVWSTCRSDVLFFNSNRTIINLWHGTFSKKIVYDYSGKSIKDTFIINNLWSKMVIGFAHEDVDIISTTSDFFIPIMQSAFNNKNTYIAGQPRNDLFFQNNKIDNKKKLGLQNNYVISYMPTHRKYGKGKQNPIIFAKNKEAERYFNDNKIKILIKLHPNMSSKMEIDNPSILNVSDSVKDPQELLYITDLLITDYSSCVVDFLLLDRPIIFYLYDDYKIVEENDLYFNLEDYAPDSIVNTESQLLIEIKKAFINVDYLIDERREMLKLFNKYNDGSSSERMYHLIKNLYDLNNKDAN
jgi:CDP-glycerol glycerophosphotransferase (TagB/SpsB family)|tara:strand:+ start:23 stop:1258 length:1236 start_codon:yes stop_codon:yes gene_type:complete